ncbi:hypothetical protein [Bremerella sp. P1]|uniref:hypothetical protein n=1 Tax=Bremerella sp. P1 TaxID=3026424 RepID=UPI002368EC35|nr:hypothetical protein [Bremerella sp. P1]WDI44593.1 hypothetical protein PSR63_11675 [Bremerella sp. P1]
MAYLTLCAVVPTQQVEQIRADSTFILQPTQFEGVSHLLAYWIEVQPLGRVLGEIVDGGELLHEDLWHPLRPPMIHWSDDVLRLRDELAAAWKSYGGNQPDDDWLTIEVRRLRRGMSHAVDQEACLVTALDMPGDTERARRVRMPWMPAENDPEPSWWENWTKRWRS